jgi:hypothetical protein
MDDAKERSMSEHHSCFWLRLVLIGTLSAFAATTQAIESHFAPQSGGYLVSTDFTVDAKNHSVISLPAAARRDDLLWIRPLRLNNDEYLILQKCMSPDCKEAQVVRAWNALGHMGRDLISSNKIPIQPGVRYMLWMQHISTQGGNSFSLYQRNSPPLVLIPEGSPALFEASDLQSAREHGPTRIEKSSIGGSAFIATFEGGSVVRMKVLRAKSNAATVALR